jgi:hypothetical protein
MRLKPFLTTIALVIFLTAYPISAAEDSAATQALFGAVHVHTQYSFDAYTNGSLTTPADAYKWAQGQEITNSNIGGKIKITRPLDFYAVSDHAEWMGVFREMGKPGSALSKHPMAPRITSDDPNTRMQAFAEHLVKFSSGQRDAALTDPAIQRSIWSDIIETADAYYQPGKFTTFPAFEWSSNPNMRNLHRVVVFANSRGVPDIALSSLDSRDPETLWAWMEAARAGGATLLAIPHNANASDGMMFSLRSFDGKPLTADYVAARNRNEPLYEITQIKGTSETHPTLSPNDEFAGFELWDYTLSAEGEVPKYRAGGYARQALLDGLSLENTGIGNPFRYGFIGDTDTHNAAASHEEYNYTGKFAFENDPKHRLSGVPGMREEQVQQVQKFSSGGLAGVWATENTREAIFDAMLRKETFGTTGPQMKVRFFGGWNYREQDAAGTDMVAKGYKKGVPMGGDLGRPSGKRIPNFLFWAMKDPDSGNLDRVQVVKGWVDADGKQHEKIYDVAWSGDRKPGSDGDLPAVGDTVNHAKGTYTNSIGDVQLSGFWSDPDFDRKQPAFYYARVLEIPTPRWSTIDSAALGIEIPGNLPVSIQERAYSSPIWYTPD